MIVCHTVYGSREIQKRFKDKTILVEGYCKKDDEIEIAMSYGFTSVVSLAELMCVYPNISPFMDKEFTSDPALISATKSRLLERFKMTEDEFKQKLQISAAFILCTSMRIMSTCQILCDLISSKDGRLLGPKRQPNDKQFVKVIMSNPDLVYKDKH